ncbi:MAG: cupredoxin domain-containing protein [Pseudomonadota bacterium]
MTRLLTLCAAALLTPALSASASAQQDASETHPETWVTITLTSFAFTPEVTALEHGRRYVLHLDNQSGGGHNFAAPEFFAAATIAPADRAKISRGRVEVGGHSAVDIHLTAPATGSYALHCTHFLHTSFGMHGSIVVR